MMDCYYLTYLRTHERALAQPPLTPKCQHMTGKRINHILRNVNTRKAFIYTSNIGE